MVIGLVAAPTTALIAMRRRRGDGFVLTAIGLALTSRPAAGLDRLAEPNYDVILSWDPRPARRLGGAKPATSAELDRAERPGPPCLFVAALAERM